MDNIRNGWSDILSTKKDMDLGILPHHRNNDGMSMLVLHRRNNKKQSSSVRRVYSSATSRIHRRQQRRRQSRRVCRLFICSSALILVLVGNISPTNADSSWWNASDWWWKNGSDGAALMTMGEISRLRARDIKRRLQRQYGYGADEVAKMIDKTELIQALSYQEHKRWQRRQERRRARLLRRGIMITSVVGVVTLFRGLIVQLWGAVTVRFVIYTDKKRHELSKCQHLHSLKGCMGIFLMFLLDMLQLWLSISVLLSWVMTSKYFFPVPNLSVRPASFLSTAAHDTSGGSLGGFGINLGPTVLLWIFRHVHVRLERYVGHVLARAFRLRTREKKKEANKKKEHMENLEEKEARKNARAKRRAEREKTKQQQDNEECTKKPFSGEEKGVAQDWNKIHYKNETSGHDDNTTESKTARNSSRAEDDPWSFSLEVKPTPSTTEEDARLVTVSTEEHGRKEHVVGFASDPTRCNDLYDAVVGDSSMHDLD